MNNVEEDVISIQPSIHSNFSYSPKFYKPKRQSLNSTSRPQSLQSGNNSPLNQSILNMKLDSLFMNNNNVNFMIPGAGISSGNTFAGATSILN